MPNLTFDAALRAVRDYARSLPAPTSESVQLLDSLRRVLGTPLLADRDQPPFDRSTRDGFALHSADLPHLQNPENSLSITGQIRAGGIHSGTSLARGTAVEIMTGAPVPPGADTVVMVEHVTAANGQLRLRPGCAPSPAQNIVPQAAESHAGQTLLAPGTRITPAEIALAASCGAARLEVFRRPTVAILATGDELVSIDELPSPHQIRNSNSCALAALVAAAGATPIQLPIVRDTTADLHDRIARARTSADFLLLSGGVSMGKYDLVERVLAELGAEFVFTGVHMQPGKPVVFGHLPAPSPSTSRQTFFGLPGNPISTEVTFHTFVGPFLGALAGASWQGPDFAQATLTEAVAARPDLIRFLPAHLTPSLTRPEVRLIPWQGSGDLAANARANCYAVLPADQGPFHAGEVITILLR